MSTTSFDRDLWGTESRVANGLVRLMLSCRQIGAWRATKKIYRSLRHTAGRSCQIRNETPTETDKLNRCSWLTQLDNIDIAKICVSRAELSEFMKNCAYPKYYYKGHMRVVFGLWHLIGAVFSELSSADVVLDAGAQSGVWSRMISCMYGCRTFDVDLEYLPGVCGDRIGADVASIPLPDQSISRIVSFYSFNCFEGESDKSFFREACRLLSPGGRLVIVPLCIGGEHVNLYDPAMSTNEESFDREARRISLPGSGNNFVRWYDREAFNKRILINLEGFSTRVIEIQHDFSEVQWPGQMYAVVFKKDLC